MKEKLSINPSTVSFILEKAMFSRLYKIFHVFIVSELEMVSEYKEDEISLEVMMIEQKHLHRLSKSVAFFGLR